MTRQARTGVGIHPGMTLPTATQVQVWYRLQRALAELASLAVADKYRGAALWRADAPKRIVRKSSGHVSLWWEPYDTSAIPPDFHSFSVSLGQRRFGMLAVAPELIQPDTVLHIELTAQMCAHLTSLVELQTVFFCLVSQARWRRLENQDKSDRDSGDGEEGMASSSPDPTPRERDVLMSLWRGETEDECARRLCLAPATVHSHRQRLFRRLDVHAPHEAILLSYALHLVDWAELAES